MNVGVKICERCDFYFDFDFWVEDWGFYERTVLGKHHYNHLLLDMSQTLVSIEEWTQDWQDSKDKRTGFKDKKLRVYNLIGSQLVCKGAENPSQQKHPNTRYIKSPIYSLIIYISRCPKEGRVLFLINRKKNYLSK